MCKVIAMSHGLTEGGLKVFVAAVMGAILLICVAQRAAANQEDSQLWMCKAEGVYTTCTTTRSLKPCQDYRTEGTGLAEDKVVASIQAEGTCSDQLLRMVSLESVNGRASIKSPCSRVTCELSE